MKITKRVPNWCTGIETPTVEVSSTEEALKVEWVDSWSRMHGFHQFSKSDEILIAEFEGGRNWWAIAVLDSPSDVNLPVWKMPTYDDMIASTLDEMNPPRP